jgi:hypothetical protein
VSGQSVAAIKTADSRMSVRDANRRVSRITAMLPSTEPTPSAAKIAPAALA